MTETSLITNGASSTDAGVQQPAPQSEATQTAPTESAQPQQQTQLEGDAQPTAKEGEAKPEGTEAKETQEGAPEKYEFKAIDGVQLDDTVLESYSDVAKELNLPQDAAQKMIDKMAPRIAAHQLERHKAVVSEWKELTIADKEVGGTHLEENLAIAKKALDTFGTPELRELLMASGLGNHPEFIRAFYRAGKAISEDKFVGGNAVQTDVNPAKVLFPNMN